MRASWAMLLLAFVSPRAWSAEGPAAPKAVTPGEAEFFERRVRPVLVDRCISCHGPKAQKSGIRVDSRAALVEDRGDGPVLTPGEPEESPLVEVIRRAGPIKMPPSRPLSPEAVADLTTWVKMGAPWPEPKGHESSSRPSTGDPARHWAFRPVADPPPPAVRRPGWVRAPVDRFILAALEAKGVAPSPAADRRTLIRRATFDLTGLPPSPADVAAFEADRSPAAFARVVARLLASPHYGERWARHWLDVSRYSDTKGYVLFEDGSYPWAYTYRDYVIDALNRDVPYDRFLVEQLAADRLPPGADRQALRALGFLTLGSRFMNNVHDVIDDRIDVVTRGLLGLTVSCARCHDHKFDPVPTRDYYSLYGVFASSVEPTDPPLFEAPPDTPAYAAFVKELRRREAKLAEFVGAKHRDLVAGSKRRAGEYLLAAQAALGQPATEAFMLLADGADLNPVMIVRWRVLLERTRRKHHPVFAPWHALAALPASEFAGRAGSLCADLARPARPVNALVARALADAPPASLADAAQVYARLLNQAEPLWQDSARRAKLNGNAPPPLPDPALDELSRVFHGPDAPPEVPFDPYGDLALLPDRPSQGTLQALRNAVVNWRSTGPGAPPRAMALEDLPTPVEPRVFLRGNAFQLGSPVPRQFLEVLSSGERRPFRDGSGRLDLARAIASRDNPLTARVLVNRVWMHHFGTPLVATPSDFGLRSDPPSHPELLDHLATAFMADGWSLKSLHARIMLSSTYQQASDDREDGRRIDPENRLLWKMNRRRLDLESMRDALVVSSGRLDPKLGGPSFPDLTADPPTRRTLYGLIDRLNLPGLFRTFDFPDPNATSAGRDATTVAPQALFLMNHPFVLDSARMLLRRPELASENDPARRVDRLYGLLFQRAPSAEEREWARTFLEADGGTAASWERYAHALLITNEMVFVD